jgi:hypothetical protein
VKVDSHEDIAVLALEKAPPTDWPGGKGKINFLLFVVLRLEPRAL